MCAQERPFVLLWKLFTHLLQRVGGRYLCYCGSGFIKGVAISTRQYVALRFVFVFSLPLQTLWQSNTWFGQRGLTALPSTRPLISHLHQQTEAWPALHHQPHKHHRNKTSSNCEYWTASVFFFFFFPFTFKLEISFILCVNTIALLLQYILAKSYFIWINKSVTVKNGFIVSATVQFFSIQCTTAFQIIKHFSACSSFLLICTVVKLCVDFVTNIFLNIFVIHWQT